MDGATGQDDFGDGDAIAVNSPAASSRDIEPEAEAPRYAIPSRNLAAVEMPANVQNIDRAVKTFGRVSTLQHVSRLTSSQRQPDSNHSPQVLDPNRNSLPIYLNPESPFLQACDVAQGKFAQRRPQSNRPEADGQEEEAWIG